MQLNKLVLKLVLRIINTIIILLFFSCITHLEALLEQYFFRELNLSNLDNTCAIINHYYYITHYIEQIIEIVNNENCL